MEGLLGIQKNICEMGKQHIGFQYDP